MTSSSISMRQSHRAECYAWYQTRQHFGLGPSSAKAFVYSWHEEGEPGACKIGYCTKDPFDYLWDGSALSHQKRLPVIFLTIGCSSSAAAKALEAAMHARLEDFHMERSCAREWFVVHRDVVCAAATDVVAEVERRDILD